jgi:hypothetical protein
VTRRRKKRRPKAVIIKKQVEIAGLEWRCNIGRFAFQATMMQTLVMSTPSGVLSKETSGNLAAAVVTGRNSRSSGSGFVGPLCKPRNEILAVIVVLCLASIL